jgi:hypothetical protein
MIQHPCSLSARSRMTVWSERQSTRPRFRFVGKKTRSLDLGPQKYYKWQFTMFGSSVLDFAGERSHFYKEERKRELDCFLSD